MTTGIENYELKAGTAVTLSVVVTNDNGLRNEDGRARLDYSLLDANGNIVSQGNLNVNGNFCNGWDGSVNAAFSFIANYLGVKIS